MDEQILTKKQRRELRRQAKIAKQEQTGHRQTYQRILIWAGGLMIIALTVWGLIKWGGSNAPTTTGSGSLDPVTNQDRIRGKTDAPVTLIEYSDFECSACAAFYPYVKQIEKDFPDKVRLVYRHFPLPQHSEARLAAQAAEAAGEQDKFWEMHDLIFAGQTNWAGQTNAKDIFMTYATQLGLDQNKFIADLASSAINVRVTANLDGGTRAGVDSTPTFFLNGQRLYLNKFTDLRDKVAAAIK